MSTPTPAATLPTKLIAVLYDELPGTVTESAQLRGRLAAAGCSGVQLNLDDAPVAEAMRLAADEARPVRGLVSVWTGDVAATLPVLTGLAVGTDVYRVTEHRRLDPPTVPAGDRADALANVAVLRRPEAMSREDYLECWLVHHTPIAIRTQATFGYVQNVVEEALTDGAPEIAAIVEELFTMAAIGDVHAFYGTGGDEAELKRRLAELMESCARFGAGDGLDLVPTSRYLWPSPEGLNP